MARPLPLSPGAGCLENLPDQSAACRHSNLLPNNTVHVQDIKGVLRLGILTVQQGVLTARMTLVQTSMPKLHRPTWSQLLQSYRAAV